MSKCNTWTAIAPGVATCAGCGYTVRVAAAECEVLDAGTDYAAHAAAVERGVHEMLGADEGELPPREPEAPPEWLELE